MANEMRYGMEDYAKDRYKRKPTIHAASSVRSENFVPTGIEKTEEQVPNKGDFIFVRRFGDLSVAQGNLMRVLNRKFQYDETADTLYNIVQTQHDRDVEKTIGRAYVSVTAHMIGGPGLSDVGMNGVKSDRGDNFSNERQSMTEWYAAVKYLCNEQKPFLSENR